MFERVRLLFIQSHHGDPGDPELFVWLKDRLDDLIALQPELVALILAIGTLGIPIGDFVKQLKDVGHGTFPGTAAEILSEDVRQIIAPGKITTDQWIDTIKEIHKADMKTTSTIMYGHVDKPFHWAKHFNIIRHTKRDRRYY